MTAVVANGDRQFPIPFRRDLLDFLFVPVDVAAGHLLRRVPQKCLCMLDSELFVDLGRRRVPKLVGDKLFQSVLFDGFSDRVILQPVERHSSG